MREQERIACSTGVEGRVHVEVDIASCQYIALRPRLSETTIGIDIGNVEQLVVSEPVDLA